MRIGIDIRTLMDKQYSGVPEYTYNLIKALLKLEVDDKNNHYKFFYNSAQNLSSRIPNFKSSNIELIKTNYPNKVFNYLLQKNLNRPRIDKILDVDIFLMPHINFVSLSSEVPSIITIHDLSFLRHPEFFSLRKNFWHRIVNVKKLLNKFDTIVAVSENTKKDIVELGNQKPEKIKIIHSGLSTEYRVLDSQDEKMNITRIKYQLYNDFILYLGTLEPRKNLENIIKAFDIFCQKHPSSQKELVIAGKKGWKSGQIDKIRRNIKYTHKIKFLGYIPREDKVYLYNLASIFIYPSFYEGFGFPPLEAMACRTPVISSYISSLPEVLSDSALLIDPYNINKLVYYIEELFGNPWLRQELINRGMSLASKYTWEQTALSYLNLFQKLN